MKTPQVILPWIATAVGAVMMAVAVMAPQLGLDSNEDWGASRRLLLTVGAVVAAVPWLGLAAAALSAALERELTRVVEAVRGSQAAMALTRAKRRLRDTGMATPVALAVRSTAARIRSAGRGAIGRSPWLSSLLLTRPGRVSLAAWAAFTAVCLSYAWYVSIGTWTNYWRGPSTYHDLLAEAFVRGQLHLEVEPSADLLALPDPYDPDAREGLAYLWDASLFGDRYYLYWGPIPALLITPFKAVAGVRVGDPILVFAFSAGALFWITRFLQRLWRETLPGVPGWAVVGAVLVAGWANPATWLLNSPWVYEATISGGQFFLWMGIYALRPLLLRRQVSRARMAWAGASLTLALGTRYSLAAPVALITALVLAYLLLPPAQGFRRDTVMLAVAYSTPFLLTAAGLAAYNQARFGDPLEFGHQYQLTSINLRDANLESLSPGNIPPNLYNYLVNPVRRLPVFPYFKPRWGGWGMSALRLPVPEGYYSRQVTGVLIASPIAWFSLPGIWHLWKRLGNRVRRRSAGAAREGGLETDRVEILLLTTFFGGFVAVLSYVVASMRYLGDFVPALMLFSVTTFWKGLVGRGEGGWALRRTGWLGALLIAWTILIGLLLGITSSFARFERLNPELFRQLTELFTF